MKRGIKTTLIIFIGILSLKGINVNAATTLPASYSQNGYDYTIDKFRIECYYGANSALQTQNKIKEDEINMPTTDLTITPELKELKSKTQNGILPIVSINLNLKMSQLFATYAQNFMNDRGEIKEYTCVLKVDYKIKKKEGYDYFYNFDHLIFQREDVGKNTENITEQAGYYPTSQVIDFMVNKNGTVYTSSGNISGGEIALANYSIASKVDLTTEEDAKDEDISLIYIHNINNFEQVLSEKKDYTLVTDENNNTNNNSNNTNDTNKEKTPVHKETKQIQKISIPDTKASSLKTMLISCIVMLLGGIVLLCTLIKPKIPIKIKTK